MTDRVQLKNEIHFSKSFPSGELIVERTIFILWLIGPEGEKEKSNGRNKTNKTRAATKDKQNR